MALVAFICVIGRQYQVKSVDEALSILDEMETKPVIEMLPFAAELTNSYERAARVLQLYMDHEDVEAAKMSIVSLCSAIKHRDEADILVAIESSRAQLLKLRKIDAAIIENLL